mmetsp:Transcript_8485/g.25497  ORF Transcript_8485/g.25497 Transcript_8485/m.25497 type:complete len:931 (+) Transcript_8485:181-2973(+)
MEKEAKKLFKSTKEKLNKAKRSYICKSLKDVVRGYRNCKTASEERAYVKKESAHIRDLFREEDTAFRRQNVLKLLFFHMNGYPTDWGQIQCLKLCASPRFKDKRVGYLGLMILLDEKQEILMMMTNCLKVDLGSSDMKVSSLALTALGNISSPEMLRDLLPEVLKLLSAGVPFIRKKSALVAARAVRKLPEMAGEILPLLKKLLAGRSGAVYLTTTTLVLEICKRCPQALPELRREVFPFLTDLLRELCTAGYDPDLTINGVTDPCMQVQALRAIGELARGDAVMSDAVVDLLTQVLSSTDTSKSTGTGVVSECVKTIFKIQAPASLRALGLAQLGKMLTAKDANSRFVALYQLGTAFHFDPQGVKKHTRTIVDCLHEPDPSIRQRAMDLVFAIADGSNISQLTDEALTYVEKSEADVRVEASTRLIDMVDRLEKSPQRKVDVFVRLLLAGDECVRDELLDVHVSMISATESVQAYAAERLYAAVLESAGPNVPPHKQQFKLERFALFVFGEYGDLVVGHGGNISAEKVLASYAALLDSSEQSALSEHVDRRTGAALARLRQVAVTSLAKLITKLTAANLIASDTVLQARMLLAPWRQCTDVESQQRACEFSTLLSVDMENVRSNVLCRLPPSDYEQARKRLLQPATIDSKAIVAVPGGQDLLSFDDDGGAAATGSGSAVQQATGNGGYDPLADILGVSASGPAPAQPAMALPGAPEPLALPFAPSSSAAARISGGSSSLLDDIFGSSGVAGGAAPTSSNDGPSLLASTRPDVAPPPVSSAPPKTARATPPQHAQELNFAPAGAQAQSEQVGPIPVLDKDGLKVGMVFYSAGRGPQQETRAVTSFVNSSSQAVTKFVLLLSVPKYMKLSIQSASSSSLAPNGGSATQAVLLVNSLAGDKPIQLRYKIEYHRADGTKREEMGTVANIPRSL